MRISNRFLLWLVPTLMTVALAGPRASAAAQEAEPAAAKKRPAAAKKFRGRLPNYYRQVVDAKQRKAIYQIQEEYAPRIEALKAQLAALVKERNEKVAGVLTPEQRKKVDDLKVAAEANRKKKKDSKPAAQR